MDEALVEHAQHDVDRRPSRRGSASGFVRERVAKLKRRCPGSSACRLAGMCRCCVALSISSMAVAQGSIWAERLNETVTAGNWPWCLTESASLLGAMVAKALRGHLLLRGGRGRGIGVGGRGGGRARATIRECIGRRRSARPSWRCTAATRWLPLEPADEELEVEKDCEALSPLAPAEALACR